MQCTCVRHTDLPNTSKLFADLIYHFDRVKDLYPWAPNPGNPALDILAKPGTVAIVTGQQVGLFSGPAYSIYKALTAIRIARELAGKGIEAVPVFWVATEDHDFAEVDHTWVFDAQQQPVRIAMASPESNGTR